MSAYITSIGTANPANRIAQPDIARFMATNLAYDEQKTRELQVLYRASGIGHRHTVIEDYSKEIGSFEFYPNTPGLEPFPNVQQRMSVFRREALPLALKAIANCKTTVLNEEFTHLITVSCTGMYAPGIDIEITQSLGLSHSIHRTSINFMGCYAAVNALKVANQACNADPDAKVLIVCVELCSIHFQKTEAEDNMVANALFGDGAAAVVVEGNPGPGVNCKIEGFHCDLATEGQKDMAWHIGEFGFEMSLSTYVPEIIKTGIKQLTETLLSNFDLTLDEIQHYAIHPGGKKILDAIEQELGISRSDNQHAHRILREYGNMSSPTVLFVLNSIVTQSNKESSKEKILSFAFGPGLTMESMLLSIT